MLTPRASRHGIVLLAGYGLLATVWLHLPSSSALADDAPVEESTGEQTPRKKTTGERTTGEESPGQESPGPVEGILVMRTGAVVSGKIVRSGDFYKIIRPYGQMHVPAELVKLRCADLEEAYAKLRETALSHKSANAQITLARWCLTNHLDRQARQELREALDLEPEREDAKRLLREVEDSINPKPAAIPNQTGDSKPTGRPRHAGNPKHTGATATPPAPTGRSSPAAISAANSTTGPAATGAHDDAVTLGGRPREQTLQFTRRIQPFLVNTCASAGCHSRDSQSGFQLSHVSPGANSDRRATERNLAQILEYVDFRNPKASSLLTVARRHRGRNGRSVFIGQRGAEKFAELESWVVAVARDDMQHNQHDTRRNSADERVKAGPLASRTRAGGGSSASGDEQSSKDGQLAKSQSDATNSETPVPPSIVDPTGLNRGSNSRNGSDPKYIDWGIMMMLTN